MSIIKSQAWCEEVGFRPGDPRYLPYDWVDEGKLLLFTTEQVVNRAPRTSPRLVAEKKRRRERERKETGEAGEAAGTADTETAAGASKKKKKKKKKKKRRRRRRRRHNIVAQRCILIFLGLVHVLIAVSTAVFFPVRPPLVAVRFGTSF